MAADTFFSILIPVKTDNKYLRGCIARCLELDYHDFEIIVLPDEAVDLPYKETVKVIPTGNIDPAKKRDMVMDTAKGKILAFIDDDAYPEANWLKNAVINFEDDSVAAVCGPAVTPDEDNPSQKASGNVYSSVLVSGAHRRRYMPTSRCEVDDYPSCNFLIRKSDFKAAGGFDTSFWPGEDTVLCLKITKGLNKKIVYDPRVLVYHHRRPLFSPHLKQIKSYALHRGYFVKRFPATSLRISYFIPTFLTLGLVTGAIIAIVNPAMKVFYLGIIAIYVTSVALTSLRGGLAMTIVFAGIILTHLTYGVYFLKGLVFEKLKDESR